MIKPGCDYCILSSLRSGTEISHIHNTLIRLQFTSKISKTKTDNSELLMSRTFLHEESLMNIWLVESSLYIYSYLFKILKVNITKTPFIVRKETFTLSILNSFKFLNDRIWTCSISTIMSKRDHLNIVNNTVILFYSWKNDCSFDFKEQKKKPRYYLYYQKK